MPAPVSPLPTLGAGTLTEDPKILALLTEIRSILSGNVDAANLAAGAVTAAKLAPINATRVNKFSDQAFTNSTFAPQSWAVENFDTGGLHDPTTNNSRITFPSAGIWIIGSTICWEANGTGARYTSLRLNGASDVAIVDQAASSGGVTRQNVMTLLNVAPTDYIEVLGWQSSGGNLNALAAVSSFWAARLGS